MTLRQSRRQPSHRLPHDARANSSTARPEKPLGGKKRINEGSNESQIEGSLLVNTIVAFVICLSCIIACKHFSDNLSMTDYTWIVIFRSTM